MQMQPRISSLAETIIGPVLVLAMAKVKGVAIMVEQTTAAPGAVKVETTS